MESACFTCKSHCEKPEIKKNLSEDELNIVQNVNDDLLKW